MSAEQELTAMRDELLVRFRAANLLGRVQAYWEKRAELVSRSRCETLNYSAEKMADGQISICYETADQVKLALKAEEGQANPDDASKIPGKGLAAI